MAATMRVTELFFDRPLVKRAVDAATRRELSRAGAFVRRRAQTSMRRRRGSSPAGSPPFAHEGSLRKLLFFSYDPKAKSVVIGPVRFRDGRAPSLLEFGGSVHIKPRTIYMPKGEVRRLPAGSFAGRKLVPVRVSGVLTYKPRPYMGPALEAEADNLPSYWRSSVRRA